MIPKGQKFAISEADMKLEGFQTPFVNFNLQSPEPGRNGTRGICIYVTEGLPDVEEIDITKPMQSECICISIKLTNHSKIVLLAIYRSPSANGKESTKEISDIIEEVCKMRHCHIVIVGDFN